MDPPSPTAAVVGTGFIGAVHVDALRRIGVEVAGVVGSSPERAAQRARAAGLPSPYPSFEAMLEDDRVSVVHVATPNHLHDAQVRAVLAAGKHVVCEKPLATSARQTAELLALAQRSGLVHAVNFNVRYYGQLRQAHRMIAEGAIGRVHQVTGVYLQDWLLLPGDWNWRLDPDLGGPLRVVADIGSHWIDLVCHLTGERVESVFADLATVLSERRQPLGPTETFGASVESESVARSVVTEDTAGILLRLSGGVRATLGLSQMSAGRKNGLRLQIDGSIGSIAFDGERPEELWIGRRSGPSELRLRDPSDPSAVPTPDSLPAGHAQGFAETFRDLYRDVYAAVAAGEPPAAPEYPSFADGHEQALVGEAILRSASEGRWCRVTQPGGPTLAAT